VSGAQITDATHALRFALAGNARLTFVSGRTGARFTYRIRASKDGEVHFVSLLTGSDNDGDYEFLGTIRGTAYYHGRRSRIGADAPGAKAFGWCWAQLTTGRIEGYEVWHEGRCGRCGRTLTVPESIALGIGPECAGRAA